MSTNDNGTKANLIISNYIAERDKCGRVCFFLSRCCQCHNAFVSCVRTLWKLSVCSEKPDQPQYKNDTPFDWCNDWKCTHSKQTRFVIYRMYHCSMYWSIKCDFGFFCYALPLLQLEYDLFGTFNSIGFWLHLSMGKLKREKKRIATDVQHIWEQVKGCNRNVHVYAGRHEVGKSNFKLNNFHMFSCYSNRFSQYKSNKSHWVRAKNSLS